MDILGNEYFIKMSLEKKCDCAVTSTVTSSRFYRPPGTRELVFGNSIPAPRDKKTKEPVNASAGLKRASFAGIMALVGPLHTMYSRSLLLSAQKVMTVLPM